MQHNVERAITRAEPHLACDGLVAFHLKGSLIGQCRLRHGDAVTAICVGSGCVAHVVVLHRHGYSLQRAARMVGHGAGELLRAGCLEIHHGRRLHCPVGCGHLLGIIVAAIVGTFHIVVGDEVGAGVGLGLRAERQPQVVARVAESVGKVDDDKLHGVLRRAGPLDMQRVGVDARHEHRVALGESIVVIVGRVLDVHAQVEVVDLAVVVVALEGDAVDDASR